MILVIVDDVTEEAGAFADDERRWEVITIGAMAVCGGGFAKLAKCLMLSNDVIFTTIA